MIIMKKIRMALSAIVMTYIFMIAPAFCLLCRWNSARQANAHCRKYGNGAYPREKQAVLLMETMGKGFI